MSRQGCSSLAAAGSRSVLSSYRRQLVGGAASLDCAPTHTTFATTDGPEGSLQEMDCIALASFTHTPTHTTFITLDRGMILPPSLPVSFQEFFGNSNDLISSGIVSAVAKELDRPEAEAADEDDGTPRQKEVPMP